MRPRCRQADTPEAVAFPNLNPMYHLALKMFVADRAKYAMLVGGLAFASLLMTQQNGGSADF